MIQPIILNGSIHYLHRTAVLRSGEREFLLVIDEPPIGEINFGEAEKCCNLFRATFGVREGQEITALGFPGTISDRFFFAVVRFPTEKRFF